MFDFDLAGLGSGPIDLSGFFVSVWEDAAVATEANIQAAIDLERSKVIELYFQELIARIPEGRMAPSLLHICDRYYGSASVSSILILNFVAAKGERIFYDLLPRSVSFLKRCLHYWTGESYRTTIAEC